MIEPIQIIAVAIAVFAISRAFLRLKDHKISITTFVFWMGIWIAVLVVAFVPGITFYFSDLFGIKRGIDCAVYISILVLFYLIFRLYVTIETVSKDVTKLTRTIAISRGKKK